VLSLLGVKTVLLCLPLAAIVIAEGVVSFAGCSSPPSVAPDGGPACQPSCPDALLDGPTSDAARDVEQGDGAINCTSACANQTMASGCPYPGCVSQCARVETACFMNGQTGTFNRLVSCESTAHFTCEATDSGLLPTAAACSEAGAAVASLCYHDAGDSGFEAGNCSAEGSEALCESCCMGVYIEGYDTYEMALASCACELPGACMSQCQNSLCMDNTPEAGDPCSTCVAKAIAPDGGCGAQFTSQCNASCIAYVDCLATCASTM
jgi:hypothetical protein